MTFYDRLTKMYLDAPIQNLYPGIDMTVSHHKAVITLPAGKRFHHAGKSIHGSVYFRLLDDACYFASMSIVKDYFLLTKNFNIDFLKPHSEGLITAKGWLTKEENGLFYCEGELVNDSGKQIAKGKGVFAKSRLPLEKMIDKS